MCRGEAFKEEKVLVDLTFEGEAAGVGVAGGSEQDGGVGVGSCDGCNKSFSNSF